MQYCTGVQTVGTCHPRFVSIVSMDTKMESEGRGKRTFGIYPVIRIKTKLKSFPLVLKLLT